MHIFLLLKNYDHTDYRIILTNKEGDESEDGFITDLMTDKSLLTTDQLKENFEKISNFYTQLIDKISKDNDIELFYLKHHPKEKLAIKYFLNT